MKEIKIKLIRWKEGWEVEEKRGVVDRASHFRRAIFGSPKWPAYNIICVKQFYISHDILSDILSEPL